MGKVTSYSFIDALKAISLCRGKSIHGMSLRQELNHCADLADKALASGDYPKFKIGDEVYAAQFFNTVGLVPDKKNGAYIVGPLVIDSIMVNIDASGTITSYDMVDEEDLFDSTCVFATEDEVRAYIATVVGGKDETT